MKRIFTASLALLFFATMLTTFSATSTKKPISNSYGFDGFYAGLGLGLALTNYQVQPISDLKTQLPGILFNPIQDLDYDVAKRKFAQDLHLGFNLAVHQFYLGPFFGLSFYPSISTKKTSYQRLPDFSNKDLYQYTTTMQMNYSLQLGAKFGFLISPDTLLFVKAGRSWVWLKAQYHSVSEIPGIVGIDFDETYGLSKTLQGYIVGAGLEEHLTQRLALALSYSYMRYQHSQLTRAFNEISFSSAPLPANLPFNVEDRTKGRLSTALWLVGFNYYFTPAQNVQGIIKPSNLQSGAFFGIAGGANHLNTDARIFTGWDLATFSSVRHVGHLCLVDFSGWWNLLAGFRLHRHRLYLAASIDSNFRSVYTKRAEISRLDNGVLPQNRLFISSITQKDKIGFLLQPGFMLNRSTAAYVNLGIVRSKFTVYNFGDVVNAATPTASYPPITNSVKRNGFRIGLGLIRQLNSWLSISIDDIFTNYSVIHIREKQLAPVFNPVFGRNTETFNSDFKVFTNIVLVTFSVNFK